MKKALTLALALCFSSALLAQKKSSFGVVANLGNYTMPQSKNIQEGGWGVTKLSYAPGLSYQFGLWYAYHLNERFQLSAEVLFNQRSFSVSSRNGFSATDSVGATVYHEAGWVRQHVNMSSLVIPVKLRYNFDEKGKTSIALGGGITFPMAQTQKNTEKGGAIWPWGNERIRGIGQFTPRFNYSFGVFRQLAKATQVGLEYMFELTPRTNTNGYINYPLCCFGDCLPFYYGALHPNMKSFSVSLRHNFLN